MVEGNVGAGKTTFIAALGHGVPERVAAWAAFLTWDQLPQPGALLATQLRILSDYVGPRPGLYERSWCSTLVFALDGLRPHDSRYAEAYMEHVAALAAAGALVLPRAVIHLRTPAAVCAARVRTRKQPGDESIDPNRLARLARGTERLLKFYRTLGVPIVPAVPGENCRVAYNAALNCLGTRPSCDEVAEAVRAWHQPPKSD